MNKKIPEKNYETDEIDYDVLSENNAVVSATECTGLMYSPPDDEYEAESYNDIYVVPKVANKKEKRLRK